MAEYIEREALIKSMELNITNDPACPLFVAATVHQTIDEAPAADVAPVTHGKWIRSANTWTHDLNESSRPIYRCSVCGRYEKIEEPFCNCGAKMDGKDGEKL